MIIPQLGYLKLSGDNYLSVIVMIIFSLFVAIAIEAFNKLAVKEEVGEGGQPRQKRVSTQEGWGLRKIIGLPVQKQSNVEVTRMVPWLQPPLIITYSFCIATLIDTSYQYRYVVKWIRGK